MDATKDDLAKEFDTKAAELAAELKAWFDEETAAIDGETVAEAPAGDGGSIIQTRPAIDSKRVVDATVITKKVLGIELPPAIIKPGGYASCEEMIADLLPKLKQLFTGEMKVRKPKSVKEAEPA